MEEPPPKKTPIGTLLEMYAEIIEDNVVSEQPSTSETVSQVIIINFICIAPFIQVLYNKEITYTVCFT